MSPEVWHGTCFPLVLALVPLALASSILNGCEMCVVHVCEAARDTTELGNQKESLGPTHILVCCCDVGESNCDVIR